MDDLKLKASTREITGKKTRFLRRQGITPTHLYGHNLKSMTLQCDTDELEHLIAQAGGTRIVKLKIGDERQSRSVMVREVQQDVVTQELLHVDFYQVKKGEKIAVEIPIVLVGEAPALKTKGRMLTHGVTSLHIESLPGNIPPQIEVDLSHLEEIDQAIHVRDIPLDEEVTLHTDPEQLVVKISHAQMKAEEEEIAEAEAEAEEAAEAPEEAAAEAEAPAEESPEEPPA